METSHYSDAWNRLLYTKISFPYETDEAVSVVSGRLKDAAQTALFKDPVRTAQ
jgi:hypothetical protein